MFKELKRKLKIMAIGEPVTDTYCMYSYEIVTSTGTRYKGIMNGYTIFNFRSWVDLYLLNNNSVLVQDNTLINTKAVVEVNQLNVIDTFTYTRPSSLFEFQGTTITIEEAEEIRNKDVW